MRRTSSSLQVMIIMMNDKMILMSALVKILRFWNWFGIELDNNDNDCYDDNDILHRCL